MKNRIKDFFNVENAVRMYRERPLALLSVAFAALSLYSVFSLIMLVNVPAEKRQVKGAVLANQEVRQDRLLSLKRKDSLLQERGGAEPLARSSAAVPFDFVVWHKPPALPIAETPPLVRVKALGEQGAVRVALIDIDGEESKLMHERDALGTAGRILRIDGEGVTWSWGTKEFRSLIWE